MIKRLISKENSKHLARLWKRLAFCGGIILAFLLFQFYISRNAEYEYTSIREKETSQPVFEQQYSLYTLKLENNRISLYTPDGSLKYSFEIETKALTEYDRKILTTGISASEEDLSQLIGELLS